MPMHIAAAFVSLLLLALPTRALATPGCPPEGWTQASLQQLKRDGFTSLSTDRANALAPALVACLDDPDPDLRDGIAYEALSAWMRDSQLTPGTLRTLGTGLSQRLEAPDPQGFGRPFAALVLAEVARTDRIAAWMTPAERAAMVERAATYLEGVRDYRGFQTGEGWRHGVAHGADWLMQLSLNPALDHAQRQRLLDAIGSQVMPGDHAYVFGEPERLATPVLILARGGLHDQAGWQAWLATLASGLDGVEPAERNADWLTRRHNLRAFLMTLHLAASRSDDAGVRALLPGTEAAL